MSGSTSIHIRTYLQNILLLSVIITVGYYMQNRDSSTKASINEISLPTQLTITGTPADSYPDERFGSDKVWNKYLSSVSNENIKHYKGSGNIGSHNVDMEFIVKPDGTITGRYHNANGISLDVNGYIDSQSGNLDIHLGHGSELSTWHLIPVKSESTQSEYIYEGTWGRKKRQSRITILEIKN